MLLLSFEAGCGTNMEELYLSRTDITKCPSWQGAYAANPWNREFLLLAAAYSRCNARGKMLCIPTALGSHRLLCGAVLAACPPPHGGMDDEHQRILPVCGGVFVSDPAALAVHGALQPAQSPERTAAEYPAFCILRGLGGASPRITASAPRRPSPSAGSPAFWRFSFSSRHLRSPSRGRGYSSPARASSLFRAAVR